MLRLPIFLLGALLLSLAIVSLSVISPPASAAIDTYEFTTDAQRERFFNLNLELRCPKCQNQSLADSNSPISEDLRAEVYRLIVEGKTDQQIKTYLVDRYGEYVLYRPTWSPMTYALWLLPILGVIIGLCVVVWIVRRSRAAPVDTASNLTQSEQQALETLLQSNSDSNGTKREQNP